MLDYFYETPRLPMFMFMEETNLVRVRVLRYYKGKLDAVLTDWDADILADEFHTKEHWNTEYEMPFYCVYWDKGDLHFGDGEPFERMLDEEVELWGGIYTKEELRNRIIKNIEKVNCPVFQSIEDARRYVFQNTYLNNVSIRQSKLR